MIELLSVKKCNRESSRDPCCVEGAARYLEEDPAIGVARSSEHLTPRSEAAICWSNTRLPLSSGVVNNGVGREKGQAAHGTAHISLSHSRLLLWRADRFSHEKRSSHAHASVAAE